jgi:Asp-tRNA(Asn)/Glu-tRNA(Gln) amidotransferase C subunit
MTHYGLWNELKLGEQIKKLKKKIKDIEEIEKSHQEMNAELHQELELEKKNHAITREDVQLKDMEIGRLMKKMTQKGS